MTLKLLKNTVLLLSILLSCKDPSNIAAQEVLQEKTTPNKELIAGANRTSQYLPLLTNKKVAMVANQTSVIFNKSSKGSTHLVDSLLSLNIRVTKVFAPEHGFRGEADAGEDVEDDVDTKTGLPLISLHGKNKKPTPESLDMVDLVLFDIQDVGVRFYTYISTLHYVMEACAEQNIPLIILDRPNPNGNYIDGPVLDPQHSSFLGMHPVPLVHGMTIGEYARMINGEGWLANGITCNIEVIPVENYTHEMEYSLPIRPSPNLPNDQAIKLYPSLGLFEGTNINAGRGTEFQFQRYGAPFLDENNYSFSYTPVPNFGAKYPKHKNQVCFGADLSQLENARSFSLEFLLDAYKNTIDKNKFFNTSSFTLHAGTEELQQQIEAGMDEEAIRKDWQDDLAHYKKMRTSYLLYP